MYVFWRENLVHNDKRAPFSIECYLLLCTLGKIKSEKKPPETCSSRLCLSCHKIVFNRYQFGLQFRVSDSRPSRIKHKSNIGITSAGFIKPQWSIIVLRVMTLFSNVYDISEHVYYYYGGVSGTRKFRLHLFFADLL